MIGGEKLRDKNSQDYLETIRENEGLQLAQGRHGRRKHNHQNYNHNQITHESSSEGESSHPNYDIRSEGKQYYQNTPKRNYLNSHQSVVVNNRENNGIIGNKVHILKPNAKYSIDLSVDRANPQHLSIDENYNLKPRNLKIVYQELSTDLNSNPTQPPQRKLRKRGPLIAKAAEIFPPVIDSRSVKN